MALHTVTALGIACALSAPLAQSQEISLDDSRSVQQDEVLVTPERDWSAEVTAPPGEGKRVVLQLDARLHVEGSRGGGCNWVLGIYIGDRLLRESPVRPRLLNKPPFFDFSDGKYHFTWYNEAHGAWMVLFADTYDVNTAGSGQDCTFVFDLSGYLEPGESSRLRLHYAQPNLPAAIKQAAPLAVRDIVVGTLSPERIGELRDRALGSMDSRGEVPVRLQPDPAEQPGAPPYEIAWSGRAESPPAQVSFENLEGWRGTRLGRVEVEVSASRAQRIWRDSVLKGTVRESTAFYLTIRPPQPIAIPADTDAVNVWVYSNHAYGATGGPVRLAATVCDTNDICTELDCGDLRGDYWEMRQGYVGRYGLGLKPPLRFAGLVLYGRDIKQPVTMYIESLAFHKRQRTPYARLERTDPPFPTSDDNMLPPSPAGCRTHVAATDDGRGAVFTSESPAGTLTYTVRPERGGLADVEARFGDGPTFRPMADAAVWVETPGGPNGVIDERAELVSSRLADDALTTRWRFAFGEIRGKYEVVYRLRGRTLIADVSCAGGLATQLDLGKVQGLPQLRGIEVPYLVFHSVPSPRIAIGGGVFTSVLLDWYHSQASRIDTRAARDEADADGLKINGGSLYMPLTDGTRNELRERVLVTVSPELHDTLPSIASTRSEKLADLSPSMFVMSSHFTPEYYRTLKRYGLDHVIAIHFAGIWWTRAGEGFAMRWRPRPELTEADVAEYRETIRSLGYQWGMLVNYTCYLPLNEYWDEDKVALNAHGELVDGWYGHYDTKPNAMPELARIVGEQIRKRYPTDCVYLDVHTNWGADAIDYEAGVPNAGMARGTILGNAECIREVHRQQSALCSEGICRWLYAGLADMDYAQWVAPDGKPEHKPLLPDFDLLRIHPLQIGTAMGYSPTCFFTPEGLEKYNTDPGTGTSHQPFYHYVAATLAHGHSAMIGYGYFPSLARTIHYYALLAGPQADYLPDTVADIAWFSDAAGEYLSTRDALRTGVRDDGKLRVTYAGGQVVHVNYHPEQSWTPRLGEREFVLPPYGWLIEKPGSILAYSALVGGRRVDYVDCPGYIYVNSGDRPATEGAVSVDGAVFVKKGEPLTVVPCGDLGGWKSEQSARYPVFTDRLLAGVPTDRGVRTLVLDAASLLGRDPTAEVTISARNEAGNVLATRIGRAADVTLTPEAGVVDYVID